MSTFMADCCERVERVQGRRLSGACERAPRNGRFNTLGSGSSLGSRTESTASKLVAGGCFDLYNSRQLTLPIVRASLSRMGAATPSD
jgi:hypothetical protein